MDDDVTLSRAYFLSLLRRAELGDQEKTNDTVRIDADEYEQLRNAAEEYNTLISALVTAGTSLESIRILTKPHETPIPSKNNIKRSVTRLQQDQSKTHSISSDSVPRDDGDIESCSATRSALHSPSPSDDDAASGGSCDQSKLSLVSNHPTYRYEHRSLILSGLPEASTLKDVAKVVRGGALLNLYIREQHGTAHVVFVDSKAADTYLAGSDRRDIFIEGKRVMVSRDEKKYYLSDGLANQISRNGITRNLVIRGPKLYVTESIIREDLNHIHQLKIVDIHFKDNHAWISLNSIKLAMSARTCMSSRLRYRGHRIDFWPDECAQAMPTMRKPHRISQTLEKTSSMFNNRFRMLEEKASLNSD